MATRVKLNDSVEVLVDADVSDVRKALNEALRNNELLAFTAGEREVVVNPAQVLYVEDATENPADASANGTSRARIRLGNVASRLRAG